LKLGYREVGEKEISLMLQRKVFWRAGRNYMVHQTLENKLGLG
jgi:hypothetical protein